MRLVSLASGSDGNSTYIGSEKTHILVDAGISNKKIETRLNELGLCGSDISGIFLTHEHSDHIAGLEVFVRKNKIPVFASRGTLRYLEDRDKYYSIVDYFHTVESKKNISLGDLNIKAFDIDHDANEPFGYRVECGNKKIAVATDLGRYTMDIVNNLSDLDALLIEANHDIRMLETGPYPYELKRRILSNKGHLSNENSGKLICEILNDKIKKILLGHLSDKNNLPELALESVRFEIFADDRHYNPKDFDIEVAKRDALSEICYV